MTYYVFNRADGSQGACEYQSEISEEILFRGTREGFEALGFNESQAGGFRLEDGQLVYDQELYERAQHKQKPTLTGKALVSFLRGMFKDCSIVERLVLLKPIETILNVVAEDEQINQSDLDEAISVIENIYRTQNPQLLSPEMIDSIIAKIKEFAEGYRL